MGDEVVPARPFSWGAFIGGLCLAVFVGLLMNVIAGFVALGNSDVTLAVMIELIPGALIAALAMIRRKKAFSKGVLAGAAVVAIIGGICGATLSTTSFR